MPSIDAVKVPGGPNPLKFTISTDTQACVETTAAAASSSFKLLEKHASSGGILQRKYLSDTGAVLETYNSYWDGTNWNKDVAASAASATSINNDTTITLYTQVSSAMTVQWGPAGWATTTTAITTATTGLNVANIADGSVSNTEFQYLDGATSNIQTQLNSKAPLASPTFTGTTTTPVLVANTRIESPTIGTNSSNQHALPSGTADILTADSTATVTGKSINANQLTGTIADARLNTVGTAGTYSYPSSVTTDANGRVSSITAGSAPAALSSTTPADVGTAAVGVDTTAARADHVHALPTVGPGAGSIAYPANITLDAYGRVTAATAGSIITATAADQLLGSTTSITSDNAAAASIGLSLSLPAAGTYLVWYQVRSNIVAVTTAGAYLVTDLYNSTDAVQISNSEQIGAYASTVGASYYGTSFVQQIVTVFGSKLLQLRAKCVAPSSTSTRTINSDANGRTRMGYVLLS